MSVTYCYGRVAWANDDCFDFKVVDKHFENNEKILSKLIKEKIKYYEQTYPNFKSVLYNDDSEHLPILSFHLTNLHYNFIVVLFNDLFSLLQSYHNK